ncbi:PREDICTED: nodulin homeobox [Lupinus angustifolius]|uniref:nodulin homeobox n=1 Tax=Lupinus angustifolius TaxID=3871 RepID=UPI00092FCF38|nr:PREDICTED: nodulin homeobox [Lupinus angustifolius]XP_019436231.1 PREDICTED: nodulin homeobox [Lupinus angustifolius]
MRIAKEEPSSSAAQEIGMIQAVKEMHRLSSLDLTKLLRDSENFTIHYLTEKGLLLKIDMEKLVRSLPLHLIAVLISSDRDEATFRYLLCGIRLLHSFCDLASRNSKVDQIYVDDVKVLEQLIDLVFYMLIILSGYRQEDCAFSHMNLVRSTLVACNFYLLTGFTSTQWQDIVHILLAHPKVEIFIDAAIGSVRMVVRCLEITLVAYDKDFSMEPNLTVERVVYYLCQQCEASLQYLQSLCQQKLFKERLLKNKKLCENGSILFLAQSILKLHIQASFPIRIKAAISRLKAKILSILLSLCEAESISYLDEVARSSQSLDLAKSVALEVFDLLKTAFARDPRHLNTDRSHPMGFVQLNAMRLADIFSDDSNFRSYMILCFTKVLTAVISLSHGDFLSFWCSSSLPETEEDATLEYDIFAAVGWVLDNTSLDIRTTTNLEFNLIPNSMPKASYAHHRTSLFVKFFANLHCFVPSICVEQERNLFILKVMECLQMDLSSLLPGCSFAPDDAPKAATASKNLCSLLSHAESLIPNFLNAEDIQILRVFCGELQSLCTTGFVEKHAQEAQSAGKCSSPLTRKEPTSLIKKDGNLKEGMSENSAFPDTNQGNDLNRKNQVEDKGVSSKTVSGGARDMDKDAQNIETSGSDTSSAKGKNVMDHTDNGELSKSNELLKKARVEENPDDEKVETVQRRKRKRNIMNDKQVSLIETALLDEPDMHRNSASLQSWADKLSSHGSEVTPSQLKNWLNNRKARLARTAKDPGDASHAKKDLLCLTRIASADTPEPSLSGSVNVGSQESGIRKSAGKSVMLIGGQGEDVGNGKVFQVRGNWYGKSLDETGTCVVEATELKVDKAFRLPYPSEATGTSFAEAESKLGVMRVLWDLQRLHALQPK